MSHKRLISAGAGVAAIVLIVVALVAFTRGPDDNPPSRLVPVPPESTLIATLSDDIPSHTKSGGKPDGVVEATWHGRPNALPVIEQEPGWLHVRLPERPNGSTTWIEREDVELATTPYRIEVDLATTRLRLFDAGELALDAPAGIGTDEAPTVVGNFYVTFLQEPLDDGDWGPFIMVTNQHSETISDWQESGDAIAAIHGPLDSAELIASGGGKASHGCIRLLNGHLQELRPVPAGTPVDVIDSTPRPETADRLTV